MNKPPFGLLVMAYGTPAGLDEVEAYYTHIRRGNPPTAEQLADLVRRYEAIGGVSPLSEITRAEAVGIQAAVNGDGLRPCRVYMGMKHTRPFIADAVQKMADDGITEAVTLVLAPHYSSMSVGVYQKEADAAAAAYPNLHLAHIHHWHLHAGFVDVLAARVAKAMAGFDQCDEPLVLFTAHSLPERILAAGDPYPKQIRETGEAVARKLGLRHYDFGWQSAGRTNEPWLGPDIMDYLNSLGKTGVKSVVVCPCGFVSDHLEVLYDIDIEAQALARQLGIHLARTASLNADPLFLQALADVVRQTAATLDGSSA